jgi:hypothetical protein
MVVGGSSVDMKVSFKCSKITKDVNNVDDKGPFTHASPVYGTPSYVTAAHKIKALSPTLRRFTEAPLMRQQHTTRMIRSAALGTRMSTASSDTPSAHTGQTTG